MAYVVWKMQKGHGPYAYLYESIWRDGRSRTKFLRYLGRYGGSGVDGVEPGSVVVDPYGWEVKVPPLSPSMLRQMAALGGGDPDLVSRPGDPARAELGSRSDDPAPARPHRLPDGSWGVFSREEVAQGDQVQVTTSRGKSWTATVNEVLEQGPRGTVARTSRGRGR